MAGKLVDRVRPGDLRRRAHSAAETLGGAASAHEMQDHHDDRDQQQYVDRSGREVKCEEAKKPEHHKHNGDDPKHFSSSKAGIATRDWDRNAVPKSEVPDCISFALKLIRLRTFRCPAR
jgi:hypothetical protein